MSNAEIKEYDIKRIKEEAEACCMARLEEEVRKRKEIEEKYYQNIYENRNLEQVSMLKQSAWQIYDELYRASLFSIIIKRLKNRVFERKLMRNEMEFWLPVFEAEYYARYNKDAVDEVGTESKALLRHFICRGMCEGRNANDKFDVEVYMKYNPDVVEKWKFDKRYYYLHYIKFGQREGRRCK